MSQMKKDLETIALEFMQDWKQEDCKDFLDEIWQVYHYLGGMLHEEWGEKYDEEEKEIIRHIKSLYLISRFANRFAGRLVNVKIKYGKFPDKIEKSVESADGKGVKCLA